ncbi:MAG TPA: succinyl-diaminopimelate desuccinylase [Gaiellaceae bacterium]
MVNDLASRLAARTLELVDVPSESRQEASLMELTRDLVPGPVLYDDGECLLVGDPNAPVVLAGHLDTVPAQDNIPGRLDGDAVHGLGTSDMKSGVALMVELARDAAPARFLFFTREEVAIEESPLPALFAKGLLADAGLVVVLEPTDNMLHAGCVGSIHARLTFEGVSAHSARPWTGVNAIHEAVRGLQRVAELEPLEVDVEGLVFREVLSVVRIAGGIAINVVPDRAVAELNFRYAPGRTADEGAQRLRELVGDAGRLEILTNSAPAPVGLSNPLVRALREAGDLQVEPKQAWTPVAQFAEQGLAAINFGPGVPAYAHKRDEQVPIANLVRGYETLQRFLTTR